MTIFYATLMIFYLVRNLKPNHSARLWRFFKNLVDYAGVLLANGWTVSVSNICIICQYYNPTITCDSKEQMNLKHCTCSVMFPYIQSHIRSYSFRIGWATEIAIKTELVKTFLTTRATSGTGNAYQLQKWQNKTELVKTFLTTGVTSGARNAYQLRKWRNKKELVKTILTTSATSGTGNAYQLRKW